MKKTPLLITMAFAGAALVAGAETLQDPWFKGIGAGATGTADLKASNGAWATFPDGVEWNSTSNALEIDLDEDATVAFNVGANTAQDTNVVNRVTVTAIFSPVSTNNFETDAAMNAKDAQLGFVIGQAGDDYYYYAWVGTGWIQLDAATDVDQAKTLTAEIDYSKSTRTVKFTVGSTVLKNSSDVDTFNLTSTAGAAANQITGVSCAGNGSITAVNGVVRLGVATYDGVKYGTLAEAVAAAGATQDAEITLTRPSSETISLPANVKVDTNGKELGGTVTIADGATIETTAGSTAVNMANYSLPASGKANIVIKDSADAASGDVIVATGAGAMGADVWSQKINVTGGNAKKEYVYKSTANNGDVTYTCQTKADLVTAAKPTNGDKLTEATLRQFLAGNANYEGANPDSATMKAALETEGANGIANWKNQTMGLDGNSNVTPAAVTKPQTKDAANLVLAVPALANTTAAGEYAVKYQLMVYNGSTWEASGSPVSKGGDISIPMSTTAGKKFRVDVVFE